MFNIILSEEMKRIFSVFFLEKRRLFVSCRRFDG